MEVQKEAETAAFLSDLTLIFDNEKNLVKPVYI